jgi:hypothetical protein
MCLKPVYIVFNHKAIEDVIKLRFLRQEDYPVFSSPAPNVVLRALINEGIERLTHWRKNHLTTESKTGVI